MFDYLTETKWLKGIFRKRQKVSALNVDPKRVNGGIPQDLGLKDPPTQMVKFHAFLVLASFSLRYNIYSMHHN